MLAIGTTDSGLMVIFFSFVVVLLLFLLGKG